MAKLLLMRHAKSEWNVLGFWTGLTDIGLSPEGELEAIESAETLQSIRIDRTYTSNLIRAKDTLEIIKGELDLHHILTIAHPALNERDYGIYTGKNKWEIKERIGEEEFQKLRRSWDYPIPNGETLHDVYNRVVPYYESVILEELRNNKTVLVVSHGNTLRALVKYIEYLSENEIMKLEIGTGEVLVYDITPDGSVLSKKILAENKNKAQI